MDIPKQRLKKKKDNWTVAEIQIVYRPVMIEQPKILSSNDAHLLIKKLWDNENIFLQEQFAALFFNQAKRMIGWKVLSTGTMTKCIVDIKLLASLALQCMCTDVIITHNHPSGNLNPSACDKTLTQTIKDALKLIDVTLIDHLIITNDGYYSFSDEGIM